MLPKLLLISEEFSCVSVPSKRDVIGREYIIEHNYHEHYMHAEGLSVNSYVRDVNVRRNHWPIYQCSLSDISDHDS